MGFCVSSGGPRQAPLLRRWAGWLAPSLSAWAFQVPVPALSHGGQGFGNETPLSVELRFYLGQRTADTRSE